MLADGPINRSPRNWDWQLTDLQSSGSQISSATTTVHWAVARAIYESFLIIMNWTRGSSIEIAQRRSLLLLPLFFLTASQFFFVVLGFVFFFIYTIHESFLIIMIWTRESSIELAHRRSLPLLPLFFFTASQFFFMVLGFVLFSFIYS